MHQKFFYYHLDSNLRLYHLSLVLKPMSVYDGDGDVSFEQLVLLQPE